VQNNQSNLIRKG